MSNLRKLNEALRPKKLVNIKVTVTTKSGESKETQYTVLKNKLSKMSGSGLNSHNIYQLVKTGKTVSQDQWGTVYTWEVLVPQESSSSVSELTLDAKESIVSLKELEQPQEAE